MGSASAASALAGFLASFASSCAHKRRRHRRVKTAQLGHTTSDFWWEVVQRPGHCKLQMSCADPHLLCADRLNRSCRGACRCSSIRRQRCRCWSCPACCPRHFGWRLLLRLCRGILKRCGFGLACKLVSRCCSSGCLLLVLLHSSIMHDVDLFGCDSWTRLVAQHCPTMSAGSKPSQSMPGGIDWTADLDWHRWWRRHCKCWPCNFDGWVDACEVCRMLQKIHIAHDVAEAVDLGLWKVGLHDSVHNCEAIKACRSL